MKLSYYLKPLLYSILFLVLNNFCFAQTKEQKFKTAVRAVITAFSKQDSAMLSKYVNKKTGVYHLYRPGVLDNYSHLDAVNFPDSLSSYPAKLLGSSKEIKLMPLQYAKLPTWSCDKEVWSKKGLFVDTTKTSHLLSEICKRINKYVDPGETVVPPDTIRSMYNLENKSRRIVLYDKQEGELVFYLSYINGQWFLTIVDDVSSDCSA